MTRHYKEKPGDILASDTMGAIEAGKLPVITLKLGAWLDTANGLNDAYLRSQSTKIRAYLAAHPEARMVLGHNHEPEINPWGTPEEFKAASAHVWATMNQNAALQWDPIPRTRWITVFTSGWTVSSGKADAFNPIGATDSRTGRIFNPHYVGFDPYHWCPDTGHGAGDMTTPAKSFEPCMRWVEDQGKQMIITETAHYDSPEQAQWLRDLRTLLPVWRPRLRKGHAVRKVTGCVGFIWFDLDFRKMGHCDWRLNSATQAAMAEFRNDPNYLMLPSREETNG